MTEFKVGDRVRVLNAVYTTGEVISIADAGYVTVRFPDGATRIFLQYDLALVGPISDLPNGGDRVKLLGTGEMSVTGTFRKVGYKGSYIVSLDDADGEVSLNPLYWRLEVIPPAVRIPTKLLSVVKVAGYPPLTLDGSFLPEAVWATFDYDEEFTPDELAELIRKNPEEYSILWEPGEETE